MKMLFLGPPGVGKGTMAARMSALLGIPHVSTGDLFRENINKQTPLGMEVKRILDSGGLVSDEITTEVLRIRLGLDDAVNGFILDGFPRTIPQAEALSRFSDIDYAIELKCTREVLIRRLTGRRSCPVCRRIYHVDSMPPAVENICDDDGTRLYIRKDDKMESVNRRLALYAEETQPLSDWYGAKGLLRVVNGSGEADAVFEEIRKIVDSRL